ncbi:MAG: hypothetical protein A2Y38_05595 [Spirochaetes bacterium GWB1_59_5]|nr:MAG: hypothetical protein A2Y38_05595 [Spirochaetes bacterium GWB1_59_5]
MIEIEITDAGVVDAFNRLIAFGENPQGALAAIGEKVVDFTKARFEQSVDPYGTPWAQNSDTTLRAALHGSGKNFTKKGALSKLGAAVLAGKKPLIGESKSLSTQFSYRVLDDSVEISSPMAYAAMQNFGGSKAEFPSLWGDIPARPFFPNPEQGLPDELNRDISDVLRAALESAFAG